MAASAGSIEPADAVSLLVRLGELPAGSLFDESLSVEDASRRNRCLIVRRAGGGWVFKQLIDPAAGGVGGHGREQCVYERMGSVLPQPRMVHADPDHALLVTELVTGEPAAPALGDETAARASGVAWGRLLRAVHDCEPGKALGDLAPPWALWAMRPGTVEVRLTSGATDELLQALRTERGAADRLVELQAGHRTDTFVHGDLRSNNVLRDGDQLTAIDWEDAGCGDHRWDVAAPLAEAVATWARDAVGLQGQALVSSTAPLGVFARALVAEYAGADHRAAELRTFVPWVGARLLQLAIEAAQTRPTLTSEARQLAQLAVNVLDRPGDATRWLFPNGAT